jgi:hypothetical protein
MPESGASAAQVFLILPFDQARLNPSPGYIFNPRWLDPYESVVSMMWKFAWINGLDGKTVVRHFALRSVDPYEGVEASRTELDVRKIAAALGVTQKTVHAALGRPGRSGSAMLRYCPKCIRRTYHSVVHQFSYEQQCPAHRCLLREACPQCGAMNPYRIDAGTLDVPFGCPKCRDKHTQRSNFIHRRPMSKRALVAITGTFFR